MEESEKIGEYMKSLLQNYESLRGSDPKDLNKPFWDLVVISASDQEQEKWYNQQLQLKYQLDDLPLGVPILCKADPPGPRIGSGGGTLVLLDHLQRLYKQDFFSWKVLFIHAGGYSKRLPSHSCSGKIFSPLPIQPSRGGPFQMLDLKLAIYLPFLEMMGPGVFITASDDIEVFNIDTNKPFQELNCEGFVALAHPSNLYIGSTHGVYVLQDDEERCAEEELVEIVSCKEVLQKPSIDLMYKHGAVKRIKGKELVYSDSAFWFSSKTAKKLADLYQDVGPIREELCVYGDFLTLLGPKAQTNQVSENKEYMESSLKVKLRECLSGSNLNILKLNSSKFYHLGTSQEYLEGLRHNKALKLELNISDEAFSKIIGGENPSAYKKGLMLNSIIHCDCCIHHASIIEYSTITSKVNIQENTILSNVSIDANVEIPPGFLYHTVPIRVKEDSDVEFVTVAFHIEDDIKGTQDIYKIQYGGVDLNEVVDIKSVFSNNITGSLWTARLFPVQQTMEQSFQATLQVLQNIIQNKRVMDQNSTTVYSTTMYSMADLINIKDSDSILEYRKDLALQITGKKL